MVHPRAADRLPTHQRRTLGLVLLCAVLVAAALTLDTGRARAGDATTCARFAAGSAARATQVTGSGERVVVLGDSYAAGLGLRDVARSWPSRLEGRVHVAGFSGSGFGEQTSPCRRASFGDRALAALRGGADLVVVQGGLNDIDQSAAAISAGFRRVMRAAAGHPVVVVGPAMAPARAGGVARVDALLQRLATAYGAAYVPTSDLTLGYLPDRLHLTPAAHQAYGDAVARRIAALG